MSLLNNKNEYLLKYNAYHGNLELIKDLIKNSNNDPSFINFNDSIALKYSAQNGHLEIVKYLIENGGNIHSTLLILSAQNGHLEIVKYLIEHGANIHINDDSPLILSAQNGHLKIVKYLIQNGANIYVRNNYILKLSIYMNLEIVKFLVENGADIHFNDDELLISIIHSLYLENNDEHLQIFKYLIEKHINDSFIINNYYILKLSIQNDLFDIAINIIKKNLEQKALSKIKLEEENILNELDSIILNNELLILSIKKRNLTIIKLLIENGADIHCNNEYPLLLSISTCPIKIIKYLVKNGANINNNQLLKINIENLYNYLDQDNEEKIIEHLKIFKYLIQHNLRDDSVLIISVELGLLEIIKYLIENTSDKSFIHNQNDYALIISIELGYFEITKYLIEHGANIHAQNDYLIRFTSSVNLFEETKYLIEHGANIHANNDEALLLNIESLFFYIEINKLESNGEKKKYLKVLKCLIENGANINAENDSALINAINFDYFELIKYLIDNGSNIHVDNEYPLIYSVYNGNSQVVKLLIENGANIHINNDYVLILSSEMGYFEIFKTLIEKGDFNYNSKNEALKLSIQNGHSQIIKLLIENSDLNNLIYIFNNEILVSILQKNYLFLFNFLLSYFCSKLHLINCKNIIFNDYRINTQTNLKSKELYNHYQNLKKELNLKTSIFQYL